MKSLNLKSSGAAKAQSLKESGRYTAVIAQIIDIGDQPGFDNRPPQECVAVVFRLNGGYEIVKKVTLSDHEQSTLMEIVRATRLDSQDASDDPMLSDLIGRALAVEVVVQGIFSRVVQVSALEQFDDVADAFQPKADCWVDDIETRLTSENAKAFVMSLHLDVKRLLSGRVRNREV